jgi:hypothetical protein
MNDKGESLASAEQILGEATLALTAADAERLEAMVRSLEDPDRVLVLPASEVERQRTLAKQRLLRQLIWETAGNLRLLKRILALGGAALFGYGREFSEPRMLPLVIDGPGEIAEGDREPRWQR